MSTKKVYISGGITGLASTEGDTFLFDEAEKELSSQGYEVVIPFMWNSSNLRSSCRPAYDPVISILLLLGCQSVYMLADWEYSTVSAMEQNIALLTGKKIIYQSPPRFSSLKQAILDTTGVAFSQISGGDRRRICVYARMVYAHYCHRQGVAVGRIAEEINRNHGTINYYLNKYNDDMRYNPEFRRIVEKLESCSSEQ